METKSTRKIVIYSNPIEENRNREAAQYALEHPESRVEDKQYTFKITNEDTLSVKLTDVCTRRIHTWTYPVKCDMEIIDEESERDDTTLVYGFFKYLKVTVPFICICEYSKEKATVYTLKKVNEIEDYDFDTSIDEFLTQHREYQYLYQSKTSGFIIK